MTTALIGHTGFVGSNILSGRPFDDLYNSSNLDQIAGKHYDLVVSAANRADSFRINEHPDEDLAEIEEWLDGESVDDFDVTHLRSRVGMLFQQRNTLVAIAGFALAYPSWVADLAGLVLVGGVLAVQLLRPQRTPETISG